MKSDATGIVGVYPPTKDVGHEVRRLSSTKENLGGVISPKPVITPPKHIKCDATGLTAPSLNNGHVAPR